MDIKRREEVWPDVVETLPPEEILSTGKKRRTSGLYAAGRQRAGYQIGALGAADIKRRAEVWPDVVETLPPEEILSTGKKLRTSGQNGSARRRASE